MFFNHIVITNTPQFWYSFCQSSLYPFQPIYVALVTPQMPLPWLHFDFHCFTEQHNVCGHVSYGVRPIVACLPAWFRFAQCLRRYRDTRKVFPHIVNAGKYSTTFFVVIFSTLNTVYKGVLNVLSSSYITGSSCQTGGHDPPGQLFCNFWGSLHIPRTIMSNFWE